MQKKVLFVVTNHEKMGDTGKYTGYYLAEVSHPWSTLVDAGYEIDFVSPKGGHAPVDGFDLKDTDNKRLWNDEGYQNKINNTLSPSEVNVDEYNSIFFAGGYGVMWDFPDNKELAKIAAKIYENGGIVSAVCHGPCALLNIKLSNGKYLIEGKKINSFTDAEERAVELENVMPFLLETALRERGVIFENSDLWQSHVSVDQRVITGQNPFSAKALGGELLKAIQELCV